MKKTILTLTLASVFAAPAMANVNPIQGYEVSGTKVAEYMDTVKITETGAGTYRLEDADGNYIGDAVDGDNGGITITKRDKEGKNGYQIDLDKNGSGKVHFGDNDTNGVDIKIVDDYNPAPLPERKEISVSESEVSHAIKDAVANDNLVVKENGGIYSGNQKVGKIDRDGKSGVITDPRTGETYQVHTDNDGNQHIIYTDTNGKIVDAKVVDNDMEPITPPNVDEPLNPSNDPSGDVEHAEKIIDDAANAISKEVDKRIGTAGAAAYNEASAYATATDAKLANHESRIGSLEKDMQAMGNKMLVLEDRMDGVVASSHAITNARPVLNSAGQFGMGVGMGAAGSKQAIAIGGAYQISDNWSGTMSVNYETKGKVSNDQLSAGVGAQYIF
ncbi:YadA C-terminal domain-containing protein [Vibrio splendidus]|uniref:YadA C-terminal domain-containing protein n=1 Tax=Vibrio splendidus TaxID=29497 RepID=UPI000C8613EA|nr:YadA C-terminal domain-containing protein [Vibrio splendidus]PMH07606.1 hypothetical protein BCU75_17760 [Vibrio splendidus]